MKKHYHPAITLAMALFLLPGCKKVIDYLQENPTAPFCPCQIKQFNYTGLFQSDSVVFSYNAAGDPLTAIRSQPGTGAPNFFFRYDRHGRFSDLLGGYGSTPFSSGLESWDRFFYDNQGRIIMDSAYFFPGVVNDNPTIDPHLLTSVSIIRYEYDTKGRISKASVFSNSSPWYSNTYSYDASGNLAGSQYDDKINYHRTNKIWMFIDRDYSVNNPLTATYMYNNFGLPTSIMTLEGNSGNFFSIAFTQYDFFRADIKYRCTGVPAKL